MQRTTMANNRHPVDWDFADSIGFISHKQHFEEVEKTSFKKIEVRKQEFPIQLQWENIKGRVFHIPWSIVSKDVGVDKWCYKSNHQRKICILYTAIYLKVQDFLLLKSKLSATIWKHFFIYEHELYRSFLRRAKPLLIDSSKISRTSCGLRRFSVANRIWRSEIWDWLDKPCIN